ncbi:MAG: 3-hydroxyacyl-CoA dehydrogenase NAD-binding domain-containing protein [Candidatus Paracaedibacter sp.]
MINQIAVIGAGQMGSGIAQVFAMAGYQVQVIDISTDQLAKAKYCIIESLSRQVSKGTLSFQAKENTLNCLHFFETIQNPETIDLALEAIAENFELKTQVLRNLDAMLPDSAILATNTSSLSITQLAANTKRPDRVIGVHFMNPAPRMPLVEVIRGQATSEATYDIIHKLIHNMGKTPVVSEDFPGFIVNRILMPMINEAIYAVDEGVATPKDIDTAMRLGTNQPMGPLELADFIGLDTCLSIIQVLHEGLRDDKYRPCPLLVKYVTSGWLGKKTGRGFYEYPEY